MIAIWNSAVSIATNDIIKRYMARNRTDRFYLNISRIIFVVLGMSTLLFALTFVGNILLSLTYVSVYMTLLAFPILAGLYWKRFSTRAALASLVVGASYVTIALAAGMPYYLISPVGVALGVFAGAGVTLVLDRGRCVPPEVDAFFASAHGQRERPVSRR